MTNVMLGAIISFVPFPKARCRSTRPLRLPAMQRMLI